MEEFDKVLTELLSTGLSLFVLSTFINLFDRKMGGLLKQIAVINLVSVIIIFVVKIMVVINNLTTAINEFNLLNLFGR